MPTSRKRIGFLPTAEVQNIIDKISLKNNLSQSKVTGILVEEALKARNLYQSKSDEKLKDIYVHNENKHIPENKVIAEDKEYILIKEYLNYKNFKKILSAVQSEI